jgi:hypothetical protein
LRIRLVLIAFTFVSLVTLNSVQALQQPDTVSNKIEEQKQSKNTNKPPEDDHVIENDLLPLPDGKTVVLSPLPLPENPSPSPKLLFQKEKEEK